MEITKGTEKQIEYAKAILKGIIWQIDKLINDDKKMIKTAIAKGKNYDRFTKRIERYEHIKSQIPGLSDDAVWYIEHKDYDIKHIIKIAEGI
jgi:2-hydroxychromene-2-carboxylate isomerase